MNIATSTFLGLVFIAASSIEIMRRRRQDVLYGPFIEGRAGHRTAALRVLLTGCATLVATCRPLVERGTAQLRWKARGVMYIASVIAC